MFDANNVLKCQSIEEVVSFINDEVANDQENYEKSADYLFNWLEDEVNDDRLDIHNYDSLIDFIEEGINYLKDEGANLEKEDWHICTCLILAKLTKLLTKN